MEALEPVVVDDRVRALVKANVRRKEQEQEVAAGIPPGPSSIRFSYRCGVLDLARASKVAVRLHSDFLPPSCFPLIVPRFVQLHQQSETPYDPGEGINVDYSGPGTEVLLLDVVGDHAIGFVVDAALERELLLGDEAWCMPW